MGQKLRGPWARAARLTRVLYPGLVRLPLRGRPLAVLSIVYVMTIIATGWYLVVPRVLLYRILVADSGLTTDAAHLVPGADADGAMGTAAALARPKGDDGAIDGPSGEESGGRSDGHVLGRMNRDSNSGTWPLRELILLCVFNASIFFCVVSYLVTALCNPGPVPDTWRPVYVTTTIRQRSPAPAPSSLPAPTSVPIRAGSNSLRPSDGFPSPSGSRTVPDASGAGAESAGDVVAPAALSDLQHGYHSDVSMSSVSPPVSSTSAGLPPREALQVGQQIPPPVVYATAALGTDGNPRFCRTCRVYKPARTHHCSVCRRCTLEMDHHCPFTGNNCIGYLNRKFFILFLYYATFSCVVVSIAAPSGILRGIIDMGDDQSARPIVWLAGNLFGYMLCLLHAIVLSIFAGFHTFLVLRNRTTIEHSDPCGDDPHRFDRGLMRNWRAVFGSRPVFWFVPVACGREGDGVRWRNIDDVL